MTKVNITRHDRGLDSRRIEKIVSMMNERIQDIKWDRNDTIRNRRRELKEQAIKEFNLTPHFESIDAINKEIKKLEKQIEQLNEDKKPHKIEIAKKMRGSEETWSYDEVREGSVVHNYITAHIPDTESIKGELDKLSEEMEEKMWLAKDIDEARALYDHAIDEINRLTKGVF